MFNFYKYSFLFIINLSLAYKIDSCSYLIIPGIYTLDKVRIDKDYYYNVRIDLRIVANPTHNDNDEYGDLIAYTLEGTIGYFKNNENHEINILYCNDFKSKDESIKESSVTLTNGFIYAKQPLSIDILNSNIIHFTPTEDALERDYQLLNNDLFPQGILEPNGIDNPEKLISAQTDYKPPAKKRRLSTHLEHNAMHLSSELTHKADNSESSIISQEPLTKNGELTSVKISEAQSSVSEIATQSSGAEAGTSNQSIGRFNGEVESNGMQKINTPTLDNKEELKTIINNLDENQSIVLIHKSSVYEEFTYTKIIINFFRGWVKAKSYSITLINNSEEEITDTDQLISVFPVRGQLQILFYPRKMKNKIDNSSESKTRVQLILDNYNLYISRNLQPEARLDKIKKTENQIISDYKKQYGQNFVTLIESINVNNKKKLSDFIQELKDEEKLVLIPNDQDYRNLRHNKIEIIKSVGANGQFGTNYYYICVIFKKGKEESIKSSPISILDNGISISIQFKVLLQNGNITFKSFLVSDFYLFRIPYTKN